MKGITHGGLIILIFLFTLIIITHPGKMRRPAAATSVYEPPPLSQRPAESDLTMDDLFSDVARLVPDFGGMFLSDAERVLQVYLLDPDPRKLRAAEGAIAQVFGRQTIPRGGLKARPRPSF